MQVFCHAVLGYALIERREVALGAGAAASAESLPDTLAVDAVVHGEAIVALLQGPQLVEGGVGGRFFQGIMHVSILGLHTFKYHKSSIRSTSALKDFQSCLVYFTIFIK